MKEKKPVFKRWWFWVILVIILGAVAAGAGSGGSKEDKDNADSGAKGKTAVSSEGKGDDSSDEVTVDEQVLMEQDGVKVTLKGIATDGVMGPELKVLVENSSGQNITVQTRDVSVNGFMMQSAELLFSCDVAAGKSANDSISLMRSDLEDAGIEKIMNVELSFHVFKSESFETLFDSDAVYVATSLDGTEEQAVDDSGIVLLERDGIKLTVKEADSENSFWGADIYIYIENTSDKNVTVQAGNVSVNGFMVQPMFSCDVAAGKKAYDTITFLESELEENGIQSIDNMEISFHVFESSSFQTLFDTDALSVSFE